MGRFKLPVARLRQSNYQQDQTQLARDTMDLWPPHSGRRPILFVFFFAVGKKASRGTENGGGGQRRVGGWNACGFPEGKTREAIYKRTGQAGTIIRALPS